ncbi:MAG: four helix bundle protein [Planctomycetes bacterium]|nr:four helix bundle protein [Planctomycetota bacterium]
MGAEIGKAGLTFDKWVETVPKAIRDDPLWTVKAYRLALFATDIGWHDVTKLMRDLRTRKLAGELYEALGSSAANLSEGYSRGSNKDRVRFYEYSLGSARESRTWYYNGRHVLGEQVALHRIGLLTEIIKPLEAMIPQQRGYAVHEEVAEHGTFGEEPVPW